MGSHNENQDALESSEVFHFFLFFIIFASPCIVSICWPLCVCVRCFYHGRRYPLQHFDEIGTNNRSNIRVKTKEERLAHIKSNLKVKTYGDDNMNNNNNRKHRQDQEVSNKDGDDTEDDDTLVVRVSTDYGGGGGDDDIGTGGVDIEPQVQTPQSSGILLTNIVESAKIMISNSASSLFAAEDDNISNGSDDNNYDNVCAICLTKYENDDLICTSNNAQCKHIFHEECMVEWLMKNEECPCCRTEYLLQKTNLDNNERNDENEDNINDARNINSENNQHNDSTNNDDDDDNLDASCHSTEHQLQQQHQQQEQPLSSSQQLVVEEEVVSSSTETIGTDENV